MSLCVHNRLQNLDLPHGHTACLLYGRLVWGKPLKDQFLCFVSPRFCVRWAGQPTYPRTVTHTWNLVTWSRKKKHLECLVLHELQEFHEVLKQQFLSCKTFRSTVLSWWNSKTRSYTWQNGHLMRELKKTSGNSFRSKNSSNLKPSKASVMPPAIFGFNLSWSCGFWFHNSEESPQSPFHSWGPALKTVENKTNWSLDLVIPWVFMARDAAIPKIWNCSFCLLQGEGSKLLQMCMLSLKSHCFGEGPWKKSTLRG